MIDLKSKGKDMEFEIRFNPPSEDDFRSIVKKFVEDHSDATVTIEQSISIMTDSDKKNDDMGFSRKEMYFVNGVQQKIAHNRKKREDMLKVIVNSQEIYRVALSSEHDAPEFSMSLAHRIRIKLRLSVILKDMPDWRYDFTAAIQLEKSELPKLKDYKERMFPRQKMDPKMFLERISEINLPNMRYEFEIEFIGKKLSTDSIQSTIKYFTDYISPNYEEESSYQGTIYNIASKVLDDKRYLEQFHTKNGLKQLANQPKNLTKSVWFDKVLPNIDNYYVSDKADGERCFVHITNGKVEIILTDKSFDMTEQFANSCKTETILDAEIVNMDRDDPAKSKHPKLYIFDILYSGHKVTHDPFEKREKMLDEYVKLLKNTEKKILIRLDQASYGKSIREVFDRKTRAYPIDGLVFTPAVMKFDKDQKWHKPDYFGMVVYKFKEPEKISVDFLIMKPPSSVLGTKPYIVKKDHELYFLFSGINMNDSKVLNLPDLRGYREMIEGIPESGNYFPIQFSHRSFPYSYMWYVSKNDPIAKSENLHHQIGEFIWNSNKEEWKLDRMRPDKAILVKQGLAFGNNFRVAEEIFNNYLNPLTLPMLTDISENKYEKGQNYFQEKKKETYKALTKLNNYVKAQLIKQLENKSWVVDLSAGRGGDLFTYNGFGIHNGLFMDIDQSALEELGNRAWDLGNTHSYVFSRAPQSNIKIYTMQNDLNTPAAKTLLEIEKRGIPVPMGQVDGVICNLSIHYVMTSEAALKNIFTLVDKILKPGGVFIFTTFDGQRIFKLLEKINQGDSWDIEEEHEGKKELKYSIRKNYKDAKFKMGLTIGVVHPFSGGKYYDEPLADVDQITEAFTTKGYKLQQKGSFADWNDRYKKFNTQWFENLTADDKRYGALYSYISVAKPIEKKPRE